MNLNVTMEVDPLSTYDYQSYDGFSSFPITTNCAPYPSTEPVYHNFNGKNEPYQKPKCGGELEQSANSHLDTRTKTLDNAINSLNSSDKNSNKDEVNPMRDKDDDTQNVLRKIKTEGKNGKRSNHPSKKIADRNYPFYGCAVCNISYTLLGELDKHIATHKDRLTSYGLRIKNQIKRKKLRKEQKKLKKLGKAIKKEKLDIEIEIKPEDGYIGETKAEDYVSDNKDGVFDSVNPDSAILNKNINNNDKNNTVPQESKENTSNSNDKKKHSKNKIEKQNAEEMNNMDKIFKCFACQKQFTLSYYLKLHVRSHTDEKPYTCAECGQCFITASKLGRHNKRIHLAIRHQCRICYKYFSRFEYLTRHFDKKHPEDKLEGEPYDYNAILPYLKELEAQLQSKPEEKSTEGDTKPKVENLWDNWPVEPQQAIYSMEKTDICGESLDMAKDESIDKRDNAVNLPVKVVLEAPTLEVTFEVPIKEETEDFDGVDNAYDEIDNIANDDVKDDSMKEESPSDDEYFPSNTWVTSPKEYRAASPNPTRGKRQKSEGPIQCNVCEKTISSSSYLRIHMRTHTGEKPFKCYVCGRGFITSSKMHRHVLTHSESWNESADVKLEVKTEEDDAGGTVKKKKKRSKDASKKGKPKFLKKSRKTVEKQKKLHQKRPHACEYCNKRFLHIETLQVHKKSHDGEELVLKCNFCLMKVDDEENLKTHEATHEGPKPFLCTLCGKTYKKRETMMYHRKNHIPEKEHVCEICSKSFNSPCKLQKHIVSHRVDKFVLRYECPVCAHMFNTKYHIQMHLVTHQKEGLIVEENRSEILAMVLQNARKIPKHPDAPNNLTDVVPPDERSRVCNICGQVFQHFYYLEEHLKSHGSKIALEDEQVKEEKKHVCKVCNKGFKLHYYLKLHSFTHTKEKPYICQQCGKGFITRGKLKRHLETHTGLKKYQCHICYKFFTRPSYLRIHVRTIHGTQDYNFRLDKQYLGHAVPSLE